MKTRTWILIFATLIVVCLAALLVLRLTEADAQTAELWLDGRLERTVDLTREQTFTVESGNGSNTVSVRDGAITVTDATCPDGVCVAHGAARPGDPIVCLPNRLVIELGSASGVDTMVG